MTMKDVNKIAKYISEDSLIKFTDGTEIKGSVKVSAVILKCCKTYNEGYMQALTRNFIIGGIGGLAIAGTVLGVKHIRNKKTKKEEGKA